MRVISKRPFFISLPFTHFQSKRDMSTSRQSFQYTADFVQKALNWAATHPYCSYFTSNGIPYPEGAFPELLAAGTNIALNSEEAPFDKLQKLHEEQKSWLIGYFTYDLKNEIHRLTSSNPLTVSFPSCTFYQPDYLLFFRKEEVEILCYKGKPEEVMAAIKATPLPEPAGIPHITLRSHMLREEYIAKVKAVKEHILQGDCYELNLCQEFSASEVELNPLSLFLALNRLSPAPFASFQKFSNQYLICASPERFLKKEGDVLTSQPIKGTIRRGKTPGEDEALKHQLLNDEKERAENMMIVDLVRNDLAISSLPGSVKVKEMFGIYSFRHVHQMISTISSTLRPELPFTEGIRKAFPMGSMTGAPKKKVMELIDHYENSSRGMYSGAVGFITPEGNFDFNVVIRSLLYDAAERRISFQAGGAITFDSDPEKEYEECLLKARALMQVLGQSSAAL